MRIEDKKQIQWTTQKRKVKDLIPYEFNPRKITPERLEKLKNSLNKFNLAEIPAVNTDNVIIAGHQRVKTLLELGRGEELIDVRVPDRKLTKKEYKEYNLISNVSVGYWDIDVLNEQFADIDLLELGIDIDNFEIPLDAQEPPKILEAEEDDYVEPENLQIDVVEGDLITFTKGNLEHRLLCGDSTDSDQVAKLMDGKKADMVFTEPPYLMGFEGGMSSNKDGHWTKSFNSTHGGIKNDKMDKSKESNFLDSINLIIQLFTKGSFYICFYRLKLGDYFASLDRVGLKTRTLITWNKGNHTMSNSDYWSKCEHIFYGWVDEHNWYGGNDYDIWEISRTQKNTLHPTMKPLPLCEKAINNSSIEKNIVFDLFLGSGSTMVASHQLERNCYGLELDPKYCQVIIDRMQKLDPEIIVKINGVVYQTKN